MNRREAIAALTAAGTAAGLGADVKANAVTTDDDIALFVLECPGFMSHQMVQNIVTYMEMALSGTPFKHVKTVVLGDGLKLRALSRKGLIDITGGSD